MRGATILVAEDDPSSSEMLGEMLAVEHYAFEVAETAGQVLVALRARQFAAVLLDLSMPGMPLDELIEELCRLPAPSPLIVFSARPAPEVRGIADRLCAAAVLPKPSGVSQMLATIDRVARGGVDCA
jgi:two-component system, OmpR family, phosphate regulon response regulator OmpR